MNIPSFNMQIIYITNRQQILKQTIVYVENLMKFIDEILIICPIEMKKSWVYESNINIKLLSEEEVLGKDFKKFIELDHVKKNYLLRSSLPFLKEVKQEFIMSDDDFHPLFNIEETFFKENNKYHSYYFYLLNKWFLQETEYDLAQKNMSRILEKKGLPLFSFSSHMPQIINKKFLSEVIKEFYDIGISNSIDEWSTYFNYCLRKHKESFYKPSLFVTLSWPSHPFDWPYLFRPKRFYFENFYEDNYSKNKIFYGLPKDYSKDYKEISLEKIKRMNRQFERYRLISFIKFSIVKTYNFFNINNYKLFSQKLNKSNHNYPLARKILDK